MSSDMADTVDADNLMLNNTLEHVYAQLDGTISFVKLPASLYMCLNDNGREVVKDQVGEIIGHPAEWYLDSRHQGRLFIGAVADISRVWPCEARKVEEYALEMLFPVEAPREEPQVELEAPPIGDFTFVPPNNAPQYPLNPDQQPEQQPQELGQQLMQPPALGPEGRAANGAKKKKNGRNPFMIFRCRFAPLLKNEHPRLHNAQISKILGTRWRNLTGEQQAPWYELSRLEGEKIQLEEENQSETGGRPSKRRRLNSLDATELASVGLAAADLASINLAGLDFEAILLGQIDLASIGLTGLDLSALEEGRTYHDQQGSGSQGGGDSERHTDE